LDHIFCRRRKERIKALDTIPHDLPSAYGDVMQRIDESREDHKEIAIKTISWLFRAQRTLSMNELLEAIAVDADDKDLERDIETTSEVIECCKSLVVYDPSSKSVRFTHFTVQEYIKVNIQQKLTKPQEMALTCLAYLTFDEFDTVCPDKSSIEKRLGKYEFSRYVAQFWGFHTRKVEDDSDVQQAVGKLLRSGNKVRSMLQLDAYAKSSGHNIYFDDNQTILHICVDNGLATICNLILHQGLVAFDR